MKNVAHWSRGQDVALSRRNPGFDSLMRYHESRTASGRSFLFVYTDFNIGICLVQVVRVILRGFSEKRLRTINCDVIFVPHGL